MELTNFGKRLLASEANFSYYDFTLTRHGEMSYRFNYPFPCPETIVAIHYGTSVEAAHLFKLLLITRRLTQ